METKPVLRSANEMIRNFFFGQKGERSLLGAIPGAVVGGSLFGPIGALAGGLATGLPSMLLNVKYLDGKGIDPLTGQEIAMKRSLSEKIDNFFVGIHDNYRATLISGLFGMLRPQAIAGGLPIMLANGLAGALGGYLFDTKRFTGKAIPVGTAA